MFRKRDHQGNLFESSGLQPHEKASRLEGTWANQFRKQVLSLIDEEAFSPLYCEDNGRPNRPVQILIGVLILKEMFNLTDQEVLEQVEWNLLWHHALRLMPEEAHLCQKTKTLHNFRVRLIDHDGARLAFETTTERILDVMGLRTDRQRLDSTHIVNNVARLTRLGLFCETIRVLLSRLRKEHPRLFERIPAGLRGRYWKDDGSATAYGDGDYTEAYAFPEKAATGQAMPIEIRFPRLAVGTLIWCRAKQDTAVVGDGTVDFFVGIHEYTDPDT